MLFDDLEVASEDEVTSDVPEGFFLLRVSELEATKEAQKDEVSTLELEQGFDNTLGRVYHGYPLVSEQPVLCLEELP